MKWLGFPIANDQQYATGNLILKEDGTAVEAEVILNDGGAPLDKSLFANSYSNDKDDGKTFMILWLHAYKYALPEAVGPMQVKSGSAEPTYLDPIENPKPEWALKDYKVG